MIRPHSSGHRPRPEADHGPVCLPGGRARNVHQGLAADPPPGAQQDAPQPHPLCPGIKSVMRYMGLATQR